MTLYATLVFLGLIVFYAAVAVWRARQASRAAASVSRLGLIVSIAAALAVFVFQWMLVSLPSWAYLIWVPAALALVYATFEAARSGPQLLWLRPGHRRSDIAAALAEGTFTLLVIAAAVASVVLALR